MPGADSALPRVAVIEAALHKTTQRLASEVVAPSASAPDWSEFEWRVAMAAATIHGVSAWLANRLRWRGPLLWEAFLAEQKHQGELRQQRIAQLLARTDVAAAQAGVAMVALKGSALMDLRLYAAGERPMGDIDLLVRPEDFDTSSRLLMALGFKEELDIPRHQILVPDSAPRPIAFGEHADNPIKIDLHVRIIERLPIADIDITALQFPRDARPGLNPYPSMAALMRHLLLHAAGNIRNRSVRLIQLQDIALLASRLTDDDWDELLNQSGGARGLWWALPPLALTAHYHPAAIPRSLIDRLQGGCPLLLRRAAQRHRLIDVSLSQIRIHAFPGVEWSRSPKEAWQYIAGRVIPGREIRSLRQHYAQTQALSAETRWYGQSQARRILRWLVSQPARVQTMHSIRLAIDYRPPSGPGLAQRPVSSA